MRARLPDVLANLASVDRCRGLEQSGDLRRTVYVYGPTPVGLQGVADVHGPDCARCAWFSRRDGIPYFPSASLGGLRARSVIPVDGPGTRFLSSRQGGD